MVSVSTPILFSGEGWGNRRVKLLTFFFFHYKKNQVFTSKTSLYKNLLLHDSAVVVVVQSCSIFIDFDIYFTTVCFLYFLSLLPGSLCKQTCKLFLHSLFSVFIIIFRQVGMIFCLEGGSLVCALSVSRKFIHKDVTLIIKKNKVNSSWLWKSKSATLICIFIVNGYIFSCFLSPLKSCYAG